MILKILKITLGILKIRKKVITRKLLTSISSRFDHAYLTNGVAPCEELPITSIKKYYLVLKHLGRLQFIT